MQITSLQLVGGSLRLEDLTAGLNVVFLASPDKRRLLVQAVQSAFGAKVELTVAARLTMLSAFGRLEVEVGPAGRRIFDTHGMDRTDQYAPQISSWLPPDVVLHVCSPRLGDPLALHETTYKVCGAPLAEEHRRRWEALLADLELAQPLESLAQEIQSLREEESQLVAALKGTLFSSVEEVAVTGASEESSQHAPRPELVAIQYVIDCLQRRLARSPSPERAAELQQKLARWMARRDRLMSSLDNGPQGMTAGEPVAPTTAVDERVQRLQRVRQRLRALEQHERQQAEYWLNRVQTLLRSRPGSPILREASQLLRELSGGEFTGVQTIRLGRETVVEQGGTKRVSCDVLSRTERVEVHLAVCLAALAAAGRAGHRLPLILNDSLRHIPGPRVWSAIERLRAHARQYGQVLLLTSQSHVAAVCRSLGVTVYYHPTQHQQESEESHPEAVPAITSVTEIWNQGTTAHDPTSPVAELTPPIGQPWVDVPTRRVPLEAPCNGVPRPVPAAGSHNDKPYVHREGGDNTGCYLTPTDSVRSLSWLDSGQQESLEKAAIYTVGAFFRTDAAELALRTGGTGWAAEQLRAWQAQARLLCEVPQLRPYDAQILVACGITSRDQLAEIQPEELYRLVHTFLSTPEGARMARSGTNEEIQRLTQWLRRMQEAVARGQRGQSVHADGAKKSLAVAKHQHTQPSPSPIAASHAPPQNTPDAWDDHHRREQHSEKADDGRSHDSAAGDTDAVCEDHAVRTTTAGRSISQLAGIPPAVVKRLATLGIHSTEELLRWNSEALCQKLNRKRITASLVERWKQQALLLDLLPGILPCHAFLLVEAGISRVDQLRAVDVQSLLVRLQRVARTPGCRRVLGEQPLPTFDTIRSWISAARQWTQTEAA